jgi:hypothetical protein
MDFLSVDDDYMIAHVHVRGECRSMLAPKHACHASRKAPQGLAFGVHEVPFLLHISWFL